MNRPFFILFFALIYTLLSFECIASSGGIPVKNQQQEPGVTPKVEPQQPEEAPRIEPAKASRVEPAKPKREPARAKAGPAVSREKARELERRRALVARKKEALDNTEWDVVMNPLSGKGKKITDTIIFSEGKVRLKDLTEQGFPATNYTLTLQEDNKVVWETMQTAGNEIVFFRGEVSANMENMNGIISFQKLEGNEDYNFTSKEKRRITITE